VTAFLAARVGAALDRDVDPAVARFAARLAEPVDGPRALAVLFYGSNLRTGSLDGVLDFYVLLPGGVERGIWPRVSYRELELEGQQLRAKIATMTIGTFNAAASGRLVDTTIWARFVQPSALAWCADDAARTAVAEAVSAAAMTAARLAAALGPDTASEGEYWRGLFRATYRAELRVEAPGREDSILTLNADHFSGLLPAALTAAGVPCGDEGGGLRIDMDAGVRARVIAWWNRRRRLGRALNVVRLLKASTTFDGAARYAAWKIHRHTGIAVEVTPWRERHPVLAAPGVVWQVWRARRARRAAARPRA